ncbi:MAG: hypothetical protein CFE31_08930 [Rhizobiales bacterium PAR1]|nr:MAG: hypothetical protein CFE31_08930 [Rhizobiales bacterium PAR1]
MMPASIFAEAIRNEEAIHVARERLATREHIAQNYRAVALPAVAAAVRLVNSSRKTGRVTIGKKTLASLPL